MRTTQGIGLGLMGAATTMLARRLTRHAMHEETGEPKMPDSVRRSNSIGLMLLLAGAAGALLAFGDVLKEQRQHVAQGA
jgi:hypothetical protein